MPNARLMDETTLDTNEQEGSHPLRVVLTYQDIAAGQCAMRVLNGLARGLGDDLEFQPLLWSFDLLSDPDWRAAATSDVLNADILLISTSSPNPLPDSVERWVKDAIGRKRGTDAAVVAIFGSEDNPDGAGSPRLEAVRAAAQQAGLDFFAPLRRSELDASLERIHQRAEMVTPVLAEILSHHTSPPWWDRNPPARLSPLHREFHAELINSP